jgi:RNA-directed DNA polymerase
VRYADDFVIFCRTRAQAEQALARVQEIMGLPRLQLHPTKTRLVELGLGQEGFTFLGCYLRIVRSFNPREWSHRRLVEEHGLYPLLGTIRYPGGTHVA